MAAKVKFEQNASLHSISAALRWFRASCPVIELAYHGLGVTLSTFSLMPSLFATCVFASHDRSARIQSGRGCWLRPEVDINVFLLEKQATTTLPLNKSEAGAHDVE